MLRGFAIAACCAAVFGCAQESPAPQRIAPPTFTIGVHFETHSSLQAVAEAHGQTAEVDGFTVARSDGRCDIHVIKPRSLNTETQELLGHELAHCLFGNYHR